MSYLDRFNEVRNCVFSLVSTGINHFPNVYIGGARLVKDLRYKVENTNPEDVLNGNIDQFIEANLFNS